ncbi:MAG TPA: cytochrome c biogenesis heme-transporting ATPase CcmA [Gammaproteobacteria bacterium]|nr:cytochrome c biogenesis heme-transporting ATPase CcmA [Gammaproteobacteria bacterium]
MSTLTDNATCNLTVSGLGCERGDRRLFAEVAFHLEPGEVLRVEGANGSGKTTLLRTLCGLRQADEGDILWNGEPIGQVRPEFNAELTYIGHLPGIKADLSPLENLAVDCALHRARDDADAMAALDRVGLFGFEDLPARTLSAGQRRRVALARLFLMDTRLWVLDEPFTALDVRGVAMLAECIDTHIARGGMVIFTTHQDIAFTHSRPRRLVLGQAGGTA